MVKMGKVFERVLKMTRDKELKPQEETSLNEPFWFNMVLSHVSKKIGSKPGRLELTINDEIAERIFRKEDSEVRLGVFIPKEIWEKAIREVEG